MIAHLSLLNLLLPHMIDLCLHLYLIAYLSLLYLLLPYMIDLCLQYNCLSLTTYICLVLSKNQVNKCTPSFFRLSQTLAKKMYFVNYWKIRKTKAQFCRRSYHQRIKSKMYSIKFWQIRNGKGHFCRRSEDHTNNVLYQFLEYH